MSKSYDTEIISVGTELLLGHVTNTDARDISEMLSKIGINVKYHTVVGDNPERLRQCVETAKSRADIIITTGGLGPTCDDLTKQILAEAFGLKLIENKAEREGLYDYIRYGKKFTDNNFTQAMLPEGCTVFHNNCGTAPGCGFEKDGKIVVMIPGPPKECNAMFRESAIRITHIPTGTVVECQDERSQYKNKDRAMQILRSKLYEAEQARQHAAVASERRSQIGSGDRSERIRTYNFPQNRVTDHRLSGDNKNFNIQSIINGNLDPLIDCLVTADQAAKLQAQTEA